MRRHAKAATAASTKRLGKGRQVLLACALTAAVLALAVGSASGALSVVVTQEPSSNTGYRATLAGTVNPNGAELDECFFEWGVDVENGPAVYGNVAPCAEAPAAIGSGTSPVSVHADITGLVPQGAHYEYRLVAVNPDGRTNGQNLVFTTPQTVALQAESGVSLSGATLNGTVNADGATLTQCVFEWGELKNVTDAFQAYPETAPCVPGPGGISGTSPVPVQAGISGLKPGTRYAYRLRVGYPTATVIHPTESTESLQTPGPLIEGAWAEGVTLTEATLKAKVNPEGSPTTYRFEYGETAAYGSETGELNVGSDSSAHEVSLYLNGLQPGTTYHYRVVATSGVATSEGPDLTFSTFAHDLTPECANGDLRTGYSADLPDCRAYELVSPAEKGGVDIIGPPGVGYLLASEQAALDGDKMTFSAYRSLGDSASNLWVNQFLASRGAGGWTTHAISPAHTDQTSTIFLNGAVPRFSAFTDDLSKAFVYDNAEPALTADALSGYYNLYLRDNLNETYDALTTQLFGSAEEELGALGFGGYSEDGRHTVFSAKAPLTPDALSGSQQLYDYHDGALELVSVLPNDNPAAHSALAGEGISFTRDERNDTSHAISADGSTIFWMSHQDGFGGGAKLYARINGTTTVPVPDPAPTGVPQYWTASEDGSQVIFGVGHAVAKGELYRFNVDTEALTTIAGEVPVESAVLGASDDASLVYFLSAEVLATGATAGEQNLYLDQDGVKTFIATLAPEDGEGLSSTASNQEVTRDFSRVTPDGLNLVFQSRASLTGYDNTSLRTGDAAIEIYNYDAETDEITCVSCNPSGRRPETAKLVWPYTPGPSTISGAEAAAWLPTPRRPTYVPRAVSGDGSRVYFNSFDALVPTDSNGLQDVYQWVADGVAGCDRPDGCISLLSTGRSKERSTFIDAGDGGRDVFFRTAQGIVPKDVGQIDIYDARVGGGFPEPDEPTPCFGDSCQAAPPAPQDPTSASASFRGAGDPVPARDCQASATRAAKLSRQAKALRRSARTAKSQKQAQDQRKRAKAFERQAKDLSNRAARCRRANRGTSR